MSDDEEIMCMAMIERIKSDHMRDLEDQEDLFKEARQQASEFKKVADTLEWHIDRMKAAYKQALGHVETFEADWSNCVWTYMGAESAPLWKKYDTALTEDEVKTMRAECASLDSELSIHSLLLQRTAAANLKLLLNKATKKEALPFRVANHMKLTIENDLTIRVSDWNVHDSIDRQRFIKTLKSAVAACDTLRETLWDKDLTLPIVHPSNRRRLKLTFSPSA